MSTAIKRIEMSTVDGAFRSVLETIPDAVAVVDREGRIAAVNGTAKDLFERSEADLLGQAVEILIPERYRRAHPKLVEMYFGDPQVLIGSKRFHEGIPIELYGARADGSEFPAEISVGPLETPDGYYAITVIRDVTEKKELERKLRESASEAS